MGHAEIKRGFVEKLGTCPVRTPLYGSTRISCPQRSRAPTRLRPAEPAAEVDATAALRAFCASATLPGAHSSPTGPLLPSFPTKSSFAACMCIAPCSPCHIFYSKMFVLCCTHLTHHLSCHPFQPSILCCLHITSVLHPLHKCHISYSNIHSCHSARLSTHSHQLNCSSSSRCQPRCQLAAWIRGITCQHIQPQVRNSSAASHIPHITICHQ